MRYGAGGEERPAVLDDTGQLSDLSSQCADIGGSTLLPAELARLRDTFAPIGPWLVTADEVPDPQALDLWLEVDGHRYQNGNTRTMVFGVRALVAYISQFMSLRSGDIISTGTPPGVGLGQEPPRYLRPGQTMRLGIAGLGEREQRTVPAASHPENEQ